MDSCPSATSPVTQTTPRRRPRRLTAAAFFVLLFVVVSGAAASGPRPGDPALEIPLDPIGFIPPSARILNLGATLFTLNFVDNKHLLFTYYTRGLIQRLPDTEPDDYDGNVAAVLLDLPTGKEVARTEWRVRDRDPYLWPLGHGQFLRRVRSRLTVINPVGNLATGDAFREESWGEVHRRIGFVSVSSTGDLVAIETLPPSQKSSTVSLAGQGDEAPRAEVEISFYRLSIDKEPGEPDRIRHVSAGALMSPNLILIPANGDGFVSAAKDGPNVFNLDFHSHAGPTTELAAFDSTCAPRVHFVSRSEFVAFGCHGSIGKVELGGFNLKGEHAWIEVLSGNDLGPTIVASPPAGRFVMSRILVASTVVDPRTIVPEEFEGQEITVRQAWNGKLLLKTQANPIQRGAQNFDLSPDGLSLATIRNGFILVYHLPLLSGKDETALKLATAMEPKPNDARILLNSVAPKTETAANPVAAPQPAAPGTSPEGTGAEAGIGAESAPGTPAAPVRGEILPGAVVSPESTTPDRPGAPQPEVLGDIPQQRRKPPTLYDPEHPRGPDDPKPPRTTPQ